MNLSSRLKTLILQAVKQAGCYDPEEALVYIEESLTVTEAVEIANFLAWVNENKLTFGTGNIDSRYAAYLEAKT